ncbi:MULTISPECIES: DUF559 domain-containing protein [unclassified Rhodococcus (in: high G+C Gram-positive bacteria)]|uniref:DUF559 domain-containing protein n=1 Tax=unclassified Rhodococcus (in: high G+C Gram-positive bacteria) TaxID=192944 RepID=UPI0006F2D045|nr:MULTISPECIES: DUF559 domain-containing protein [unclassified Rhodococcus (in: high G+C Gram-positive bacteria)]KQU36187.1 hypothetical protein ASG69_17975 [Rhodococcus sp. Leaf225]KQU48735.1 hypothetical protein ASH03_02450 [Rhodococcus sp. Leaf258]
MGVHTRRQLIAGGISGATVDRRAARGELHRLLPGVYSTEPPTYEDRCAAVRLWKPHAVASHDTAAWIWGLLPAEPSMVHVTVPPTGYAGGPNWVRVHRRALTNVRWLGDIPVVSLEHAILDVAGTLTRPQFEEVIDSALSRAVSWRSLAQLCDKAKGMTGMRMLRDQLRRACPHTLSEPERMVARALTARNMHLEINGKVGPYYGDLVDRRARVVVEIDGREFHTAADVFTSDRRRQNALVLDDWLVLRYSAATVKASVAAVADEIVQTVRRRRSLARG